MNKKIAIIACVAFACLFAGLLVGSLATLSEEKVSLADKGLDVQASEELFSIQKFATGKETIIKDRYGGDHIIEISGTHEKFIYDGYLVIHMLEDGSISFPKGIGKPEKLSKSNWIIVPIGDDIVVNR